MTIEVYAILKDFFDPRFQIDETIFSVADLRQKLISKKPLAENVLKACRFAVNNEFVTEDFKLGEHDTIAVLPPASGG